MHPRGFKGVLIILELFGRRSKSTNVECTSLTVRAGEFCTGTLGKETTEGRHTTGRWSDIPSHNPPAAPVSYWEAIIEGLTWRI